MRIGIPRALFYYHYYPLWKAFFENLEEEVILSSPTNKTILKQGIDHTVDDACLPVKIYHGHVVDLIGKVDVIYAPRIVSIEAREFICPKFLGLPDMIKNNIPNLPEVIDLELNLYHKASAQWDHFYDLGKRLGKRRTEIIRAYRYAVGKYREFERNLRSNEITPAQALAVENPEEAITVSDPEYTILVLGHPYNIYDEFLSFNLIDKLKKRKVKVITYEMMDENKILQGARKLPKKMFWSLGKYILGGANYYLNEGTIDGIISVASFGCGPNY